METVWNQMFQKDTIQKSQNIFENQALSIVLKIISYCAKLTIYQLLRENKLVLQAS